MGEEENKHTDMICLNKNYNIEYNIENNKGIDVVKKVHI